MVASRCRKTTSRNKDGFGFDFGLGNVSINPRPFLQRKRFHARRRKGAGLDPGSDLAKNVGGFLKAELERIHPEQLPFCTIENAVAGLWDRFKLGVILLGQLTA